MKKYLIFLFLILGMLRAGFAQRADIDAFIKREMTERHIPGLQLAVVKHGKIDLLRSYGIANISNHVPVDNHSIFAVNSCTKAFTGVAIMQLVEQGTISLDAAVGDYIDRQLRKKGFDPALPVYRELQKAHPDFNASETDLNDWAYRMMSSRQLKEATAVFKLVTEIYPDSWNAYDSYGEALLKSGQRQEAIRMYQQSITLNPDNTNGKKILERLQQ